jgi:hypothetical protein
MYTLGQDSLRDIVTRLMAQIKTSYHKVIIRRSDVLQDALYEFSRSRFDPTKKLVGSRDVTNRVNCD